MASLIPSTFVRRPIGHRTTESTCTRCSLTVATAKREEELDQAEQGHVCDPWLLEQWNQMFEHTPDRREAGHSSFTFTRSPAQPQVSDHGRFHRAENPPVRQRPGTSSFAEFKRRTFTTKSNSA